ncbi:YceD family protein [Sinomicrobium sp. M5D2P17]
MKKFKEFDIPFVGLKQGEHRFGYRIDNLFFEGFDYTDFNDASLKVDVVLHKRSNMLELDFAVKGTVNVNCDLSNEPFDQKIKGALNLIVKFGEEYNDENEEILILPHGEHHVNVAQYIYEMTVLSVPAKKVHPGIKDGSLDSEIVRKLTELQPGTEKEKDEETDPRWDTLKKLLTDK